MLADILHKVTRPEKVDYAYRPRPSSAGPGRCLRQLVYHRMKTPPSNERDDRMVHVLVDSSWDEELTADHVAKSAYHLHSQQMAINLPHAFPWLSGEYQCVVCAKTDEEHSFIPRSTCHGHIDGIVTDLLGNDFLYEHKALNHFGFERLWAQKEYPEDYLTQIALYLASQEFQTNGITRFVLLVKNKNTSGFFEYTGWYDQPTDTLRLEEMRLHTGEMIALDESRPKITEQAIDKFHEVESRGVLGTLPDRPYDHDAWQCTYCNYQDLCWAGFYDELKSLGGEGVFEQEWAEKVDELQAVKADLKVLEDKKDHLQALVASQLHREQLKKAKAGKYTVTLQVQSRKSIDWKSVPPSIQVALDPYRTTNQIHFIRVTQPKETA